MLSIPLPIRPAAGRFSERPAVDIEQRPSLVGHPASRFDGGTTWLSMPPTIQAKTSIMGLKPGSSVMFKHRSVTKTGAADWRQPITLPVVK